MGVGVRVGVGVGVRVRVRVRVRVGVRVRVSLRGHRVNREVGAAAEVYRGLVTHRELVDTILHQLVDTVAPLEAVEVAACFGGRQAVDHLDWKALDPNPAACEAVVLFQAVHVGACKENGNPEALVDLKGLPLKVLLVHVGAILRYGQC